jgi:hypothetical protein
MTCESEFNKGDLTGPQKSAMAALVGSDGTYTELGHIGYLEKDACLFFNRSVLGGPHAERPNRASGNGERRPETERQSLHNLQHH